MPGDTVSAAQAKLENVVKQIEQYITNKGILTLKIQNDVETYLNMSREEMHRLEASECSEAGIILMRYAGFLQECYNKELARLNFAEAEIRRAITPQLAQYNKAYQTYEERKSLAIAGDDYLSKLEELRMWAQAVADRLAFMSQRVDAIAKGYFNLQQTKRRPDGR